MRCKKHEWIRRVKTDEGSQYTCANCGAVLTRRFGQQSELEACRLGSYTDKVTFLRTKK